MPIAAVTGLAAEARIARSVGIAAIACGGDAARTEAAADRLLAEGAAGLVSFGIAGALAPDLAPGTLLLPRRVRGDAGEIFPVADAWRARIAEALHALRLVPAEGDLVGLAHIVASAPEKAELHRRTGALAVDLESHVVAQRAMRFGRPFLALRAVADPAGLSLPPAASIGLSVSGHPAFGRVLLSVALEPRQIPALLRLACDTRRALAVLSRAAPALSEPT